MSAPPTDPGPAPEPPIEVPIETGAEGVQPARRQSGHRWFDIIMSVSAILISLVSLYLAVGNEETQRKLLSANSWPFLRALLSNGYDDKGTIAIGASNGGVGPAKVKSFELFYKGVPVASGTDLLRRCCGLRDETPGGRLPRGYGFAIVDETVIRPGEDTAVLRVYRDQGDPQVYRRLKPELLNVSFRACYCSVLDECWIGDMWTTRTTPVEQCPVPPHRFEPNGH